MHLKNNLGIQPCEFPTSKTPEKTNTLCIFTGVMIMVVIHIETVVMHVLVVEIHAISHRLSIAVFVGLSVVFVV